MSVFGGPTCASTAPLATFIDRHGWRHATRMKNAPGYGPRQRRQLQGVLGGMASTLPRNRRKKVCISLF